VVLLQILKLGDKELFKYLNWAEIVGTLQLALATLMFKTDLIPLSKACNSRDTGTIAQCLVVASRWDALNWRLATVTLNSLGCSCSLACQEHQSRLF
jgi:hypothetical protein